MTVPDGYRVVAERPSVESHLALRSAAGLSTRAPDRAADAIAGSWAFRLARTASGESVAMGRVVGDGGWYFVVADMAVHPAHQRQGLGGAILDGLLAEIRRRAGRGASVTLTADPPGRTLYASRGFVDVAPQQSCMRLAASSNA